MSKQEKWENFVGAVALLVFVAVVVFVGYKVVTYSIDKYNSTVDNIEESARVLEEKQDKAPGGYLTGNRTFPNVWRKYDYTCEAEPVNERIYVICTKLEDGRVHSFFTNYFGEFYD